MISVGAAGAVILLATGCAGPAAARGIGHLGAICHADSGRLSSGRAQAPASRGQSAVARVLGYSVRLAHCEGRAVQLASGAMNPAETLTPVRQDIR